MRHRNTEIIKKILHIVKVFAHNVKKQPQLSGKAMQSHLMIYAVISTVTDMKHCWHQQGISLKLLLCSQKPHFKSGHTQAFEWQGKH